MRKYKFNEDDAYVIREFITDSIDDVRKARRALNYRDLAKRNFYGDVWLWLEFESWDESSEFRMVGPMGAKRLRELLSTFDAHMSKNGAQNA